MPYKTKALKFISTTLLAVLLSNSLFAQKKKIDGVGVVVGKNIVLDSDIDKFKQELESKQNGKVDISDCEMLEQLMLNKLLAHHAVVDSVEVSDAQVNQQVERNIQFFKQEFGSEEKMLNAYGFNDLTDLKKELFSIEKERMLVSGQQQNLTESIDITPEEVRIFYNGLKEKNELPEFQVEFTLSQLAINANPTKEAEQKVIEKLNELKKEIEEGSSFRMKAIINSEDPGVVQNGGKYTVTKNAPLVKEFKEVSFDLELNEVSAPFKSSFGYHIIQLHEVQGEKRIVSHILMSPEIPESKLQEVKREVEKVKKEIEEGSLNFEEAVRKYSTDKSTKNNDGLLMNQMTGEPVFEMSRMDPDLYGKVHNLKQGEVSDVYYDQNKDGEKMFKIFFMKERTETHTADLIDDYEKIQALALQKKKLEAITKWAKEKINDTYIKLGEEYKKCTFEKNWKKEID